MPSPSRSHTDTPPPALPFNPQPKPWRCPICYGRGTVPVDFYANIGYATSTNPVKCRSCGGQGIVFS